MVDIRPVLTEHLKTIASERARLDQMEAGIKALLELESGKGFAHSGNGNDNSASNGHGDVAGPFVLETLRQAKRALTVDDFKTAATKAGLDFGKRSPGRVLHWSLVAKARSGVVEKENGKWRLKEVKQ
jgi:hypothetical protein